MNRTDLIVVGAGPAGMSAAIEAAKRGAHVTVLDENSRPGGQLFKQIHKFFGSKEHHAKVRGFVIGEELMEEAARLGVDVRLDSTVIGLYQDKEVVVREGEEVSHHKADAIVIATGAAENMVTFEGWTLPGVIGAGAAQTMMNLHGVRPGERVLMLGTGNGWPGRELPAQAGRLRRGGARRRGAPRGRLRRARGEGRPHRRALLPLAHHQARRGHRPRDRRHHRPGGQPLPVCPRHREALRRRHHLRGRWPLAMSQLFKMDGCKVVDDRKKGGQVPVVDDRGETSIPGIFAAGDVSGIEEASSAMIEGRIAGLAAAEYLGFIDKDEMDKAVAANDAALDGLRQGMFAPKNRGELVTTTEEGIPVSQSLLEHGYVADDEIARFPGVTGRVGIHPVMECTQNIPCNPCQDACLKHCIKVGDHITQLPAVEPNSTCIGCGMCVASCPGQAIFLVDEKDEEGFADVTLPYEFLPVPAKGDRGVALGRDGSPVCEAEVVSVRQTRAFDHTTLLTMRVPADMAMRARFFRAGSANAATNETSATAATAAAE